MTLIYESESTKEKSFVVQFEMKHFHSKISIASLKRSKSLAAVDMSYHHI